MKTRLSLALIALLGISTAALGMDAEPASQRPLRVRDLFALEHLGRGAGGAAVFSPDAAAVAFTKVRTGRRRYVGFGVNLDRDVWLQDAPGQAARNLTDGQSDLTAWWSPQWSPDGARLSMLSSRGDYQSVWLWEKPAEGMRRLGSFCVTQYLPFKLPLTWVDPHRVVLLAAECGKDEAFMQGSAVQRALALSTAQAGYEQASAGQRSTASVLDSGVEPRAEGRPENRLLLVDVRTGETRVLAQGAIHANWQLSPDRGSVAYARQLSSYVPSGGERLRGDELYSGFVSRFALEVVSLDGARLLSTDPSVHSVLTHSVRWSMDGAEIAFLGFADAARDTPRLYHAKTKTRHGRVESISTEGLNVLPAGADTSELEWTSSGQWLLAASASSKDQGAAQVAPAQKLPPRVDWWLIRRDGRRDNLTAALPAAPEKLWAEKGRKVFVGAAGGEVWRVSVDSRALDNLTARFEPAVQRLVWPAFDSRALIAQPRPGAAFEEIVFTTDGRDDYRLDLASGKIAALDKPEREAALIARAAASNQSLHYLNGADGLRLWRSREQGARAELLLETNTFMKDVAPMTLRMLEYTSAAGDQLKAWVLLPVGYAPGRRYPLIVTSYPGAVMSAATPTLFVVDDDRNIGGIMAASNNLRIAASHGYAVMVASVPLARPGTTDEPLAKTAQGVLPAIDAAVQTDFVDAERIFVMGHSFGGFAACALVTQTSRFKAAIASAPITDWISFYNAFAPTERYSDYGHEARFSPAWTEVRSGNFLRPPSQDWEHYQRNSPLAYVDKVQTPIMLVQGDLDYVPIQQSEEFFYSLYRLGRRARFVRYWGEDHLVASPANALDFWSRALAWFDEFGDLARDAQGGLIFEQGRAKSRGGAAPLTPEDFRKWL